MREIKFRAWDNLHDIMLTDIRNMIFDSSKSGVEQVYGYNPSKQASSDSYWLNNQSGIFMQFTGLQDKNGKDVYEGDILKLINFRSVYTCSKCGFKSEDDQVGVVVWRNEIYGDEYNHDTSAFMMEVDYTEYNLMNVSSYEIIGNIYENPELKP